MRSICKILMLAIIIFSLSKAVGNTKAADSTSVDTFQKVNFFIDFSDYKEGSVEQWLKEKGFVFERDARDRKKIDLDVGDDGLILEAKQPAFGIIINEGVDLEEFTSLRLEWGITQYPEGASYEKGIKNEALMVIVFFGYDKVSSGHFFIPNTPYFIGFFLGKEEVAGKGYTGRYFKKSGRYVCLGNPKPGETVISEYELVSAFKRKFESDEVPVISGIALSIDTQRSGDGGRSAAFIKSIEFLE
jgi:hypothetical protein